MRRAVAIAITFTAFATVMQAQRGGAQAPAVGASAQDRNVRYINPGTPTVADTDIDSHPIPRMPDGHPDLTGPWLGGGSNGDIEREGGLKPGELPLQQWARDLRDKRVQKDEPFTACLPMGVPRSTVYPWKFVYNYESNGLTHIYVLHETGDAGAHRVVYMDGRQHPTNLVSTWFGHSIGRWDGDTLVIDTIGFNDKFWFDSRGTPHTERLHTVERWTRTHWGRLEDDLTIDDPGAFTRPVQLHFVARLLRPNPRTGELPDLMEFICLEDNEYGRAASIQIGSGTDGKK